MRAHARLVLVAVVIVAFAGCAAKGPSEAQARIAELKDAHRPLHERLAKAAAAEPLVASALAARGQVVLAIRSGLLEDLAGNVARRYLDHVTVDLNDLEGHSSGELRKKTLLGRVKFGEWRVDIEMGALKGPLRAGAPRVGLRAPDLIDVQLPMDVSETEGDATLHFGWDSSALANVVCEDFELTREIRGRVLAQRHVLSGALRLANTGEALTVTPVFVDRVVPLKLDLTARSWAVVEAALRSQDTLGKCGLLMDPDRGLVRLRALAAKGVKVRLPDSVFRQVSLPTRLRKAVQVNQRPVALRLTAESLRVDASTVWSGVSVQVEAGAKP